MKNKNVRYCWNSKSFRKYLLINISIFFIVFNVLSAISMGRVIENIKEEEKKIVRNKLYTVAEDIEMQIATMQEIALEIASLKKFRLDYFSVNKYREIEMLESLSSYTNDLRISEQFFLIFSSMNTIFTSTGSTMPLSVYFSNTLGKNNTGEEQKAFEEIIEAQPKRNMIYRFGDIMLFLYPLEQYALGEIDVDGVLCFQVKEKDILKRVEMIVGKLNGDLSMSYSDFLLLGESQSFEGEKEDNLLTQHSLAGNVKLYFELYNDDLFSWSNVFTLRDMYVLFAISIFLIILSVVIAYWNWAPMRKFTEKYKKNSVDNPDVGWYGINNMIDAILQEKNSNIQNLKNQYQHLREHIVRLIASGNYSDKAEEYITLLDIHLDEPCFAIMECPNIKREEILVIEQELYRNIENLSGEGIYLYSFWSTDYILGILVAMEESYRIEDAVELLYSLLETYNLSKEIQIKGIYNELKNIGAKKKTSEVMSDILFESGAIDVGQTIESDEVKDGSNSTAKRVIDYIKKNYMNCELSLDMIADEFQVSSAYLCRIIKQEINMSYKDFLTKLRINEAKRLLLNKNLSVVEVCQKSGYNNASYFIKIFQKHTGTTPAKYRDEYSE